MKKFVLLLSIIIIVFSWLGCQNKKDEIAYPVTTCDTLNVKYSVDIVGILQANCNVCHASAIANSSGGGNKLDTYSNLQPYAQFGSLLNSITRSVNTMPKGAPKLSDCNIAKIRTWVRNGYPNN